MRVGKRREADVVSFKFCRAGIADSDFSPIVPSKPAGSVSNREPTGLDRPSAKATHAVRAAILRSQALDVEPRGWNQPEDGDEMVQAGNGLRI